MLSRHRVRHRPRCGPRRSDRRFMPSSSLFPRTLGLLTATYGVYTGGAAADDRARPRRMAVLMKLTRLVPVGLWVRLWSRAGKA